MLEIEQLFPLIYLIVEFLIWLETKSWKSWHPGISNQPLACLIPRVPCDATYHNIPIRRVPFITATESHSRANISISSSSQITIVNRPFPTPQVTFPPLSRGQGMKLHSIARVGYSSIFVACHISSLSMRAHRTVRWFQLLKASWKFIILMADARPLWPPEAVSVSDPTSPNDNHRRWTLL